MHTYDNVDLYWRHHAPNINCQWVLVRECAIDEPWHSITRLQARDFINRRRILDFRFWIFHEFFKLFNTINDRRKSFISVFIQGRCFGLVVNPKGVTAHQTRKQVISPHKRKRCRSVTKYHNYDTIDFHPTQRDEWKLIVYHNSQSWEEVQWCGELP